MLNTLGVVQVHPSDAVADSKLQRKLGGKPLLEWIVRRATDCQRLDRVVVLLGTSPADDELAALVPADVSVFRSRQTDQIKRLLEAVDKFQPLAVVRLAGDNPLVDPVLIDRLVSTAASHPHCDYIGYCPADGRPAVLSTLGVFAEWFPARALRRADREAKLPVDRDEVTRYLYAHPEKFSLRLLPVPAELDRQDVRLKLDSQEDWENLQVIYEALGSDWDYQQLAGLLDQQPAIRSRMAVLNRRDD